jgi:CBS domain-containing protein
MATDSAPQTRAAGPLTAADVMTPSPRTCSPFSSVLEAVLIFRDADCGAVPVVDSGKPIGVLTDRDVALALADHPDLASRPVSEVMSADIVSVPLDASLVEIKEAFGAHAVRRLLVTDGDGQLLGIIAFADVAPYLTDRAVGEVVSDVVTQP